MENYTPYGKEWEAEMNKLPKAELIKMMLNQGNSIDTISKITGLPASEIQKLI